jgi:hypothetical protein
VICPDCSITLPDTPYKVTKDGIYVYQEGEAPKGTAYPLELEVYYDWKGRRCWREVHKCPKCMRELEMNMMEDSN